MIPQISGKQIVSSVTFTSILFTFIRIHTHLLLILHLTVCIYYLHGTGCLINQNDIHDDINSRLNSGMLAIFKSKILSSRLI
jgi:hypothetical protein